MKFWSLFSLADLQYKYETSLADETVLSMGNNTIHNIQQRNNIIITSIFLYCILGEWETIV